MTWLVTGGAGYIGCHVVRALHTAGIRVIVLDDLSAGKPERLPAAVGLEAGSILDQSVLDRVFEAERIVGVVHLAARKRVDESVAEPSMYFRENVEGLRMLLDRCDRSRVRSFLFSSSGAVYGAADSGAVSEAAACRPVNPYGQSKLAGEWLVQSMGTSTGMHTMALRYFNVAGAADPGLGDVHGDNLIPAILRAIKRGDPPTIFGTDYPTPDGTCVRDFVDVRDVADAHAAAVRQLEQGHVRAATLNIGTGRGVSVRSVVDEVLAVTGSDLVPVDGPRRAGDVQALVARVERAREVLGWSAEHSVSDMVSSAWHAARVSTL